MRLCYYGDPTSIHTVKWLTYFLRRGDEVHLLGWNQPDDPSLAAVRYHHLPAELRPPFWAPLRSVLWRLGLWSVAHARQMDRILRQIEPDLFEILMLNAPQIAAALVWRGPLVVTPWGDDLLLFPHRYNRITRYLLRRALRKASLVLCNSGPLERAARDWGARSDRIRRVGVTIDFARFRQELDGAWLRAQLGIVGHPVLFSPRQFLANYRIEVLIQALPAVLHHFPDAQLLCTGNSSLAPEYVTYLEAELDRLCLRDRVILPGWLARDALPYAFALADVVVSVPVSDSRPASVLEAMACGVPVVASDLESVREIVRHDETGLLVPVDDPQAVAAAVIRILSDQALRERIVSQALEFVRRDGDYDAQMARVAGYYDELLRR
jgi:L-malate glycosyltransferase